MVNAAEDYNRGNESAQDSDLGEQVQLIEEQFDSGLRRLLETYKPRRPLDSTPVDGMTDRFAIDLERSLPFLDSEGAKAYEAEDLVNPSRSVYALICSPDYPQYYAALEKMRGIANPSLLVLHDFAVVHISTMNENRLVLFLEKPQGVQLSDLISRGQKFGDTQIIKNMLGPFLEVLELLRDLGLSHGRINPGNIFIGDQIKLGEFYSEPPGMSQPFIYEPVERMTAEPYAKGAPNEKTDTYALAMIAFELCHGIARFKVVTKHEFITRVTMLGIYNVLVAAYDVNPNFSDFFRGTLLDNRQERWGLREMRTWVDGKRYNIIAPMLAQAGRPFAFNGQEYFNTRSLAYGLSRYWRAAGIDVPSSKLDRWIDIALHNPDMGDLVTRSIKIGARDGSSEKSRNEMLGRIIAVLDPQGPLRTKDLAFNIDGIGPAAAYFMIRNNTTEMELLVDLISADMPNFLASLSEVSKTKQITDTIWQMQRERTVLTINSVGFGMERMVYDLNPSLPCLSPILKSYYVVSKEDALLTLDALARTKGDKTSLLDKHLASFLASKINLTKELRLASLEKMPALKNNEELKVILLLNMVQEKAGKPRLIGLATWAALRMELMLESIHNRRLRRLIKKDLRTAAGTGYLSYVLGALVESKITRQDHLGFRKAHAIYQYNYERIKTLENQDMFSDLSHQMGGKFAMIMAYLILTVTFYIVLDQYLLRKY